MAKRTDGSNLNLPETINANALHDSVDNAVSEFDGDNVIAEPRAFSGARLLAAWEIVSVVVSAVIAEWAVLALSSHKLWLSVPLVCAFAFMIYSHRQRGETLRELGWRTDIFMRAARLLLLAMLGGALLLTLVGWLWFGGNFSFGQRRAGWEVWGFPVWGFAWGLLQQYVLQSFINRRAQEVFGQGGLSVLLVAAVFALLHLPNPWLMGATFCGGLIWAAVYQRAPNLYALALSHALMTWALISTLPGGALHGLRVGYKYFG